MRVKALVLCAGFGTRLGSLTRSRPKPLLPIDGQPLLAHTLRHLRAHGIDRVAINLHYRGDMIARELGDGARFGVTIHYEHEEALLGTAGSVRNLAGYFADAKDVLVVYGDILFDEDLASMLEFHRTKRADATLMVHRRAGSNSRLRLNEESRIVEFQERPSLGTAAMTESWVNSGVQLLRRDLIRSIPDITPADLPRDVYVPTLAEHRYFGYPLRGFRCAIDSPERYHAAVEAVRQGRLRR